MLKIVIVLGVYFLTFLAFWLICRKRNSKDTIVKIASLVALGIVVFCAGALFEQIVRHFEITKNRILIQALVYFLLIYGFRSFQDFVPAETEK